MKAGWKTTEFWKSLLTTGAGLGVMFGLFSPESVDPIVQAAQFLGGGFMAGHSVNGYARSRGDAKRG